MLNNNQLVGFGFILRELSSVVIDPASGSVIGGTWTDGGQTEIYVVVTSRAAGVAANGGVTDVWSGKTYSGAKIFSKALLYGSNNGGFDASDNPSITINIYGKNGAPANKTDGTLIGTLTFTDTANESAGREITSTDLVNSYTSIWFSIIGDGSHSIWVAEATFYEMA
jgi:hypothetical protein